jgi:hypothetical protein
LKRSTTAINAPAPASRTTIALLWRRGNRILKKRIAASIYIYKCNDLGGGGGGRTQEEEEEHWNWNSATYPLVKNARHVEMGGTSSRPKIGIQEKAAQDWGSFRFVSGAAMDGDDILQVYYTSLL